MPWLSSTDLVTLARPVALITSNERDMEDVVEEMDNRILRDRVPSETIEVPHHERVLSS